MLAVQISSSSSSNFQSSDESQNSFSHPSPCRGGSTLMAIDSHPSAFSQLGSESSTLLTIWEQACHSINVSLTGLIPSLNKSHNDPYFFLIMAAYSSSLRGYSLNCYFYLPGQWMDLDNPPPDPVLNTSLHLTDTENTIHSLAEHVDPNEGLPPAPPQFHLMATLFTTKNFNHNALKNYLEKHWKGRFPVSVKERSPNSNLYLTAFHCEGDRRRTILNQPWIFDKCPILLEIPDTDSTLSPETMRKIPFWVQVHNIPFSRRSISLAKLLGQIAGTLLEIHQLSLLETWGSYMRVRIMFDVTKPLPRGIPIVFPGLASPTWLDLKYEDIPDHCYYCGRLGHSYPSCTEYMRASDESTQPPPVPYENVLRGTTRPNHGPFGILPNPFILNSPAIVSLPNAPTLNPSTTNLIPINHPRGQVLQQDFSFHNNPTNYADAAGLFLSSGQNMGSSPLVDQGAGPSNLGPTHSFAPPGQLHSLAPSGPNFVALLSVATGGILSCSVSPQQSSNPGSRCSSSPSSSQLQAPLMISTSTAQLDSLPVAHITDIPSSLAFAIGSNVCHPVVHPEEEPIHSLQWLQKAIGYGGE
ncbi:hypothetical protein F8388_020028 [Cannabis sativa]|uniref:CCHC-type domain-containing protein n=1 Tax=Cannabis sativa TaxID=3483 RepID=A0A7J6ER81_CANSA|nr:hypothetical protein F8388_020028 [Cannabis sativa]